MTRRALFDLDEALLSKQIAREQFHTVEFWFRRKYNLTRTDHRFLDATRADMLEDYWLHTYFDDPKAVTETVEDDDFDPDKVAEMLRNKDDFETLG